MVDIALDLEDIFLFFFDNVGINTCYIKVMAMTFLASLALKTFLVVLVFFANLALVSKKLVLVTRYISRKNISRLNLSGVLFLFFCRSVSLETP